MHGPRAQGGPPTEDLPSSDLVVSSARVMVEFLTRIGTDDDPWSPNRILGVE